MTREIPTPLRAAAGLAAYAIDEARRLPSRLSALPVTAIGAAMQASMKVQQRYTELVGRGDELLGGKARAEERPPWARFDEDERGPATRLADAQSWALAEEELGEVAEDAEEYEDYLPGSPNGTTAPSPDGSPPAGGPAAGSPEMGSPEMGGPAAGGPAADEPLAASAQRLPLADYDRLSLPQLRARLRALSADDLRTLIDHERVSQARPPFLTMLENRLATVTRA